ncbi:Neuroligin-1-like protein, partial [Leptotrombidium deliense]
MASNLFSRVILMSGSALSPWALALDAETYARNLAKVLNCPNFDNVIMVDCLRSKSVDEILRVDLKVPQYLTSFGPIVDGIVVPSEPKVLIKKALEQSSSTSSSSFSSPSSLYSVPTAFDRSGHASSVTSYDLLFGITRVETPFVFSGHEEKHGIDLSRRDRVLRTLVRNLFDYHQQ